MSCQEARGLLDAYVDGELDLVRNLEFEHHAEGCIRCRTLHEQYEALRRSVRTDSVYFRAPEGLEKRIRAGLRGAREQEAKTVIPRWFSLRWRLAAVAAGVVALVVFSAAFIKILWPSPVQILAQEVVSSHIRSLMVNHLTDVPSSDQHTVKPWFTGKLDFAPAVRDLAPEGFPLTGGRLDYLDGHPVAALVYKRRQHTINLFVWPSSQSDSTPKIFALRGYNLVRWTKSHMAYWAVSDLNAGELTDFVRQQEQ